MWNIYHDVITTDTREIGNTIVEAKTRKEALDIFNKKIANGRRIYKTTIEWVFPLIYYTDKKG